MLQVCFIAVTIIYFTTNVPRCVLLVTRSMLAPS